ncbi:MAG: zinc finger domain-containing protein [Candidatus Diapherotrites archaeon]
MRYCSSCGREVTKDFTEFKCPKCGKSRIIRCAHCKVTSTPYKCIECNFEGP